MVLPAGAEVCEMVPYTLQCFRCFLPALFWGKFRRTKCEEAFEQILPSVTAACRYPTQNTYFTICLVFAYKKFFAAWSKLFILGIKSFQECRDSLLTKCIEQE